MENGLEFSYLTTRKAFVYLQIKEEEPYNLYYYLSEPFSQAEEEGYILLSRTAVGQTLTVCIMALSSEPRDQAWRSEKLESGLMVKIDVETILQQLPEEAEGMTPPPSVYKPRVRSWKKTTPYGLRTRQKGKKTFDPEDPKIYEDPQSPSTSSDEGPDSDTPSKPNVRPGPSEANQKAPCKSSRIIDKDKVRQQAYCTQACLLE